MQRRKNAGKTNLVLRDGQHRCLSSYALWAVILTESRLALFVLCGLLVRLFWIMNELMESGIVELLQLKNCGIRIYTGVCYGPAISFSRGWITERHSLQPIGIGLETREGNILSPNLTRLFIIP